MANWYRYLWIAALPALSACLDSVATPILLPSDGGAEGRDAGPGRDGAVPSGPEVPDGPYCAPVANWPDEWAEAEHDLLEAINDLRASRPHCGSRDYDDLKPLQFAPELRCAARLHSRARDTDELDIQSPEERVAGTGFRYEDDLEESIASGGNNHAQVLINLRESWDDCNSLFNPRFDAVGIGKYKELWTLDYAERP